MSAYPESGHPEQEQPKPSAGEGVFGGSLFRDEHHLRRDLQLARRAIREGWPMRPEDRLWLWSQATHFLASSEGRVAKAAQTVLSAIEKTNPRQDA